MKNRLPFGASIILVLLLFMSSGKTYSQTAGTLSFSVTTSGTSTTSYGTNNVLAIWIEDSQSAFIKTKIEYASNGTIDHLGTWTAISASNITDATTGATRTNYGTITFLWDGKNVNGTQNGTLVADGTYNIWLELAFDRLTAPNEGKAVNSYSFTKGPVASHLTPADVTNFKSVDITWTPLTTGIEGTLESKDFNVYPNPTSGLLKIDFKKAAKQIHVNIIDEAGKVVYTEKIADLQPGVRTLDLTGLKRGNYYCTLHYPEKDVVFSIILVK